MNSKLPAATRPVRAAKMRAESEGIFMIVEMILSIGII